MSSIKNKSCILTSYFTLKNHPQSGDPNNRILGVDESGFVQANSHDYIKGFHNSVINKEIDIVIFHDNLCKDYIKQYSNSKISFVKVVESIYSNNDYRFFCYLDWLKDNNYETIFMVDLADVTVSLDPNDLQLGGDIFFCEDQGILDDYQFHATNYFEFHKYFKWENFQKFYDSGYNLLNMGVIGARYENAIRFLSLFCQERIRAELPHLNINMPLGNYIARKYFNKVYAGEPFCSEFKKYQKDRKDVYFIHK